MLRTVIYNAQLSRRYHYFCFFLDFCFFWPKKKSIRGFLNPVLFKKLSPAEFFVSDKSAENTFKFRFRRAISTYIL